MRRVRGLQCARMFPAQLSAQMRDNDRVNDRVIRIDRITSFGRCIPRKRTMFRGFESAVCTSAREFVEYSWSTRLIDACPEFVRSSSGESPRNAFRCAASCRYERNFESGRRVAHGNGGNTNRLLYIRISFSVSSERALSCSFRSLLARTSAFVYI